MIAGVLLLMVDRAKAAPDDRPAPPPVEPVTAAPEPASPDETPSLVLPDDTHDEGHQDPIAKISELETRLDQMQSLVANRQPRVIVGGYIDVGFFATQGNGSGIIRDKGNVFFPQYGGPYGWLFLGDLLATPDQHPRRAGGSRRGRRRGPRYDTIHSGGAPGFIANEINLTMTPG